MAWSGFQNLAGKALSLIIFLLLARNLTPEEFGVVAMAAVFISFVQLFLRVGLSEALIQRKDLTDDYLDTAFWFLFGLGCSLAILVWLTSSYAASVLGYPNFNLVLNWLALSIVFLSLSRVHEAILRRRFRYKNLALRTLLATSISGSAAVIAAFNGAGIWALVLYQVAETLVGLVVLWLSSQWRPGFQASRKCLSDLFSFGKNVMGVQFLHFVNQDANRFLIGYFLGPVALGFYTVANRMVVTATLVVAKSFLDVLFSTFSRIQDDVKRSANAFLSVAKKASLITLPVFVYLAAGGEQLIEIVFGEKWIGSSTTFQVLALAGAAQSITIFHEPVFKALGKPEYSLRVSLLQNGFGLLLALLFVQFGIVAVAWAMLIKSVVVMPLSFSYVKKLLSLTSDTLWRQYQAAVLAASCLSLVMLWGETMNEDGSVVVFCLLSIASFFTYLFVVCLVDRSVVMEMIRVVRDLFASRRSVS